MASKKRKAFTLVELLVVIGIIAVLISILLPSLNKARRRAKNVQCMSQLHNLSAAILMYANANKGKLPQHESDSGWLWDIPILTRDSLVKYGATRNTLYCPLFIDQNSDSLWSGTFNGNANPNYCVIGYSWLGRRLKLGDPTKDSNVPSPLFARQYLTTTRTPPPLPKAATMTKQDVEVNMFPRVPAETELVADAAIRQGTQWTAKGGWNDEHMTPHVVNGLPEGVNILFLDGHVGFRPYKASAALTDDVMRKRGIVPGSSPQVEFWF